MTAEEISQTVHVKPTKEMLESGIMKIIDIRTESEWKQTGVLPQAHCITFFDEFGNYDVDAFIREYEKVADKEELVGLICRTGTRTRMVADFMRKNGYNAVNLDGGVFFLPTIGVELVPYNG
jgi:rhodanese-related sulfurtransferase